MLDRYRSLTVKLILEKERHLNLSDSKNWIRIVDRELHGADGKNAVDFSAKWARLMQYLMRNGLPFNDCVVTAYLLLFPEGRYVDRNIFRKATDLLLTTWEYKEELLDWFAVHDPAFPENMVWYELLIDDGCLEKMISVAQRLDMRITAYVSDTWLSVWPDTNKVEVSRHLRELASIRLKKEKAGLI